MSMELNGYPLHHQPSEAQEVSQEMTGSPGPDGGVRAWLQVLGGFMVLFNAQ